MGASRTEGGAGDRAAGPASGGSDGPGGEGDFVELHVHSTASDGTSPPAEVARKVADAGLAGFSLTDHDTVAGLGEAAGEARRLGLRFLAGTEISANEPGRSVHVLAFGFDPEHEGLREFLDAHREDRVRRAREIVERLRAHGVALSHEAVREEAGEGVPTRAHVGRALVREGLLPDQRTAFGRYLSRGRPAFVEKRPTPPAEVFEVVHEAGGLAVLAHPGRTHRPPLIRRWIEEGLDGIELLHPRNDADVRKRLGGLVEEFDLVRTGGSDWHGEEESRHSPLGSQRVPLGWMEELVDRCGAIGPSGPPAG